jgi:DNA mismatch endonuclease (patch repair protein)
VRKYLFSKGFRYILHDKRLRGKPDIVLPKYKTVIFVHGCFWHGHEGCKYYIVPETRTEWWLNKINQNKSNDIVAEIDIQLLGWKIIKIWECDLKGSKLMPTLENLLSELN